MLVVFAPMLFHEDIVTPLIQANKEGKVKHLKGKKEDEGRRKPSATLALEEFSMWSHTNMKLDVVLAKHQLETAARMIRNGKNADAAKCGTNPRQSSRVCPYTAVLPK